MPAVDQIALLVVDAAILAVIYIGLFRMRRRTGLALLYVTVGSVQFLQVILAMSVYVEVAPGMLVSPGSSVLFASSLFAILLVYIRAGAMAARTLVYGVIVANVVLSVITPLFGMHLTLSNAQNFVMIPEALFFQNPRVLLSGTVALFADVLLLIVVYEGLNKIFPRSLFLAVFGTLTTVMAFDSAVFATLAFIGTPNYAAVLTSGLLAKLAAGLIFSVILTGYLQLTPGFVQRDAPPEFRDVFHTLSYRRKYELTREQATRDPLTGLFNRGVFDRALGAELLRATELSHPTGLLVVDADRFKQVNDTHGHPVGDKVLAVLANTILGCVRATDLPCRFGGEEFAIILPEADLATSERLAHRLREHLARAVEAGAVAPLEQLTITIGVASSPEDAADPVALLAIADRRMYVGKAAGRDQVVAVDDAVPPA